MLAEKCWKEGINIRSTLGYALISNRLSRSQHRHSPMFTTRWQIDSTCVGLLYAEGFLAAHWRVFLDRSCCNRRDRAARADVALPPADECLSGYYAANS